jgi:hypothetical protein
MGGPNSMQIDYELKQSDFIDSFAAHRSRNIFSKWLIRLLMSFAIIVAVFLAFGLIVRPNAQDTKKSHAVFRTDSHVGRSAVGSSNVERTQTVF